VEGAIEAARHFATEKGHSTDGTLEVLKSLQQDEDPDSKITVISKGGFWQDGEMNRKYTDFVKGDYLWQIDSDEFYLDSDINTLRRWIVQDPSIDGANFRWLVFWGDENYVTDGWLLRWGKLDLNRLFRWESGYQYRHYAKGSKGPDVIKNDGYRLSHGNWISAEKLANLGIYLYHFSLVFPKQVLSKSNIYSEGMTPSVDNSQMYDWAHNNWVALNNPFRVHNRYEHIAWLKRYRGLIPKQAAQMFEDIRSGQIECSMRQMDDVIRTERSPGYKLKRLMLSTLCDLRIRWHGTKKGYLLDRAAHKWVDSGMLAVARATFRRLLQGTVRRLKRTSSMFQ